MLAALLWLAVAGSLIVYGFRLYRWIGTRSTTSDEQTGDDPDPLTAAPPVGERQPAPVPESAATAGAPLAPGPPTSARTGPRSRPTVVDALSGIAMPCDLAPVVARDGIVDPFRVAFATDSADAIEISSSVAGELVRLGYAVQPAGAHGLQAMRAGADLSVTILHAEGGAPAGFPTVPAGSVVVEFAT
jgi:hypothetical protein